MSAIGHLPLPLIVAGCAGPSLGTRCVPAVGLDPFVRRTPANAQVAARFGEHSDPGPGTARSPSDSTRRNHMRKRIAAVALTASMLAGGAAGMTLFGPSISGAQTSPSSPTSTQPARGDGHRFDGHRFGGPASAPGLADQRAVVAKAIGISEADLTKAIESGKTIAQVAHDHDVDPQKVIDALVADAKAKLAEQVKRRPPHPGPSRPHPDRPRPTDHRARQQQPQGPRRLRGPGGPGFPGRPGLADQRAVVAKAIGISESRPHQSHRVRQDHRPGRPRPRRRPPEGDRRPRRRRQSQARRNRSRAGHLTQAQADRIQTDLVQRITERVNSNLKDHGRPGGPGFPGPGGPGGPWGGGPHGPRPGG